jgi:hypothetical protein
MAIAGFRLSRAVNRRAVERGTKWSERSEALDRCRGNVRLFDETVRAATAQVGSFVIDGRNAIFKLKRDA